MQVPLSLALRDGTHELHRELERSGFMQRLLRGALERPAYCALLRNLYEIYATLEAALARLATRPRIAPVMLDGLPRAQLLALDLAVLHGAGWRTELGVLPGTHRYLAHLHGVDAGAPDRLLAHAYVRYLGDLSGGQILRGIVATALGLDGESGTRFYDFGSRQQGADLARRFRAGLDAIELDAAEVGALVTEACLAFTLHRALFEELMAPTRATAGSLAAAGGEAVPAAGR